MENESAKPRFPYELAMQVAEELKASLEPVCQQVVIAGSLRRKRALVGDVELLFIPKYEDRLIDMFATGPFDLAAERIGQMLEEGLIAKRPKVNGTFTWGESNKLAIHVPSRVPVDFFATTRENWWVSLVVRTGGKLTNLSLTGGAIKLGRSLNAYGCGVTHQVSGKVTKAHSEEEVFKLCGVPFRKPEERR